MDKLKMTQVHASVEEEHHQPIFSYVEDEAINLKAEQACDVLAEDIATMVMRIPSQTCECVLQSHLRTLIRDSEFLDIIRAQYESTSLELLDAYKNKPSDD
jgi:hypothetical protein